jgi:hypothetical protein
VAPRRVVERLDVIEDGKLSVMAAGGNRHIEPAVGLEGAPKGLHRRIIVTVSCAAHAALDAGGLQSLDVIFVDVLAAAVGVMQEPLGWIPAF